MNVFFNLHTVADGVWAAIVVPGSGALGNAAIIDLGDSTVVVDTFSLPQAAELLKQAAEQLTGKPVQYVINTHYHGDHHYGNQVFTDSQIITTGITRDYLTREPAPTAEAWQDGLQQVMTTLEQGRQATQDNRLQTAFANEIADKAALLKAVPDIRRVTASLTFSDKMMIYGSTRSVSVLTFGGGHTESDAMVYVEDAGVLIAGDLVLSRTHPAMLSGSLENWLRIIEQIEHELTFSKLIPGHGEVADRSSLEEMTRYLRAIPEYVQQAAASSKPEAYWLEQGIPAAFADWEMSHVFGWNFRWLYQQMKHGDEVKQ
ncbi:MBL fold metallo-hydrolase [Paenibacillus camerounensis]|uniref:MBL fold metallo-hydrolase n=1 Tax=Paenibacillus camerounensis TaxID=1243663 RepID=UPI0005AB0D33|nr:MBL fold metallo-hydrolase [Paenibacillus camerounensis]